MAFGFRHFLFPILFLLVLLGYCSLLLSWFTLTRSAITLKSRARKVKGDHSSSSHVPW